MNKFLILLAISLSISGFSQTEIKPLESKITDVTVFLQGAQVTRNSDIQLSVGEQTFKISQLSPFIDGNSIQIKGSDKFTIVSVKHQINYQQSNILPRDIQLKKDSLEEMQFTLKMRQRLRSVYQNERGMMQNNQRVKGDDQTLLVEDLEEMADFYRKKMTEIEYKLLEIQEEEIRINKDISRLNNQIYQYVNHQSKNSGEILVTIKADSKTNTKMEFSYLVGQAGWFPVYDVRAKDIGEPIELVYRGQVYQSTGNDWSRVSLTLSTGNPTTGGQAPQLRTWNLYLQDLIVRAQFSNGRFSGKKAEEHRAFRGNVNEKDGIAMDDYEETDISYSSPIDNSLNNNFGVADIKPINFNQYVNIQSNSINTEFNISIPYDIPTDGQVHNVEMQRSNMSAEFQYLAIPKLDKDAFLVASIADWQQYNLLAGESNIYFQGTFVGKAFIDPANTEDSLSLSMGRDPGIVVKRERIKDYCKTTSILGKKKATKGYEIVVRNNKSKAVKIVVEDQIPISNDGEIEVIQDDVSGGSVDETSGKVTWEMNLKPGEMKTVYLKYTVKYPKKKVVPNL